VSGISYRRKSLKLALLPIWAGLMLILIAVYLGGCGKTKEIVRYKDRPAAISLIYPPPDTFITVDHPTFIWHKSSEIVHYQLQVSITSDFVKRSIDITTSETTHTTISVLSNNTFFWRVRGDDNVGTWGDWSDGEIRSFIKSDYVNYIDLLSQSETSGIPQDVFVRNDTAYVADGQAGLTLFDVSDPRNPAMIRNIDLLNDDFAKGIYVSPIDTFPHVYVADMDGRIQAMNLQDTTGLTSGVFGSDQNLEDVDGVYITDTTGVNNLWIIAVSSGFNRRKVSFYQMLEGQDGSIYSYTYQLNLPADALGLCIDSGYVYVADGTSGLRIVDFHDPYFPNEISSVEHIGTALSVAKKDNYVYATCDREGIFVINVTDKNNPDTVRNINTKGRSKDVQIVGNYAFIADADQGLRVIDISVPDSAHIVASYTTDYAYGVWADANNVYLCDRDAGLLIFENKVSR
jgi:hypothetical protein